ncbi:hypothetical protein ATCC90586_006966 [Pythium insidiosum]|nr:hypothetical protein ATCC90586_006966 [Pythium insidiosum]
MLTLRRSLLVALRRPQTPLLPLQASAARAFSGNVEYPRIEGSVADVTKSLNTIGARLSVPTAALYLTKQKLEYVVRGIKTPEELREVQRALLLCDAKFVYPSEFAISTFLSTCVRLQQADVALELLRQAQHTRHYVKIQSFVRLATHYADAGDDATVEELAALLAQRGPAPTTKWFAFRVAHAKRQGQWDAAVALAKEAAAARQINSHVILTLLEGQDVAEHRALAEYLVAKGDVHVNDKLRAVLDN